MRCRAGDACGHSGRCSPGVEFWRGGRTYLSVTTLNTPRGSLPTSSQQRRPRLHPHSPTPASSGSAIRRQPRPPLAGRCHRCRSLPPGAPAAPTSPTENSRGARGEAAIARTGAHPHITRPKNGLPKHSPTSRDPKTGLGWSGPIYRAWRGRVNAVLLRVGIILRKKGGPPWLLCATTPGSTPPRRGNEAGVVRDDRRGADGGGAVGLTWACSGCFGATRR